ncbi:hypothetical protein AX774_g1420 [Zancudomyces culisetae]|uniref:Uncharacterized protein n=1 Tax=Zancudomyces culisetae TaxID=1213189 RepID=A0A1R1PVQ7_ZANCU|nr:hypothetical protein AX774_g1420 [Zancudomyces culisetae]|eukprot:OMH85041.1 hypothetical protein AX774_g1420 [Zancudomyces culisetae]
MSVYNAHTTQPLMNELKTPYCSYLLQDTSVLATKIHYETYNDFSYICKAIIYAVLVLNIVFLGFSFVSVLLNHPSGEFALWVAFDNVYYSTSTIFTLGLVILYFLFNVACQMKYPRSSNNRVRSEIKRSGVYSLLGFTEKKKIDKFIFRDSSEITHDDRSSGGTFRDGTDDDISPKETNTKYSTQNSKGPEEINNFHNERLDDSGRADGTYNNNKYASTSSELITRLEPTNINMLSMEPSSSKSTELQLSELEFNLQEVAKYNLMKRIDLSNKPPSDYNWVLCCSPGGQRATQGVGITLLRPDPDYQ